ncbi:FAD-dependent oxidoreductase [Paenibacillus sp. PsM32]|uniref:NAD(P)/FAD-dependent oxidoreductase n=1 Tax=Paenibacillus sp. PsM32 TaxID=3030536 RepID=UPI00263B773C|nr:FAD-dependent oxidoreductase [Paenibacillus sp. PsM32]MDN4617755.1 FAD-dependent oxidoreductase [Paenibacillus sp. PsM32]
MVHLSNLKANHYDVIVVGAGVIGAAIAYELAQQGVKVALLEKNQPASGASGAAGGMLAAHSEHFAHPELYQLALYSQSLYSKLATDLLEKTGIDIGLRTEGFLLPLTKQELQLRHKDPLQADQRYDKTFDANLFPLPNKSHTSASTHNDSKVDRKEWWSPSYLAQVEPHIYAPSGMIYNPDEPQLIPALFNQALVQAAIQHHVDFYPETEVYRLLHSQGKNHITGVITNQGEIYAEQVVLTTGLSTQQLLVTEQYSLPLVPVKGELIEVSTSSQYLGHTIYGEGIYIIPKSNHRIWIGATSKPERTDTTVDLSAIAQLLSGAEQFLPAIGSATFERCWSGIRPGTPDELPYLGRIQPLAGLWTASGHYRNGMLLAAGTAKWMAEALINNDTAHIPDCFSPERALQKSKSLSSKSRSTAKGVTTWN